MATATTISSEAADLMSCIASRMGPYTRRGQVELAGERIGLSPTQARRLAYQEWKQVPAHVMDRLRALYVETCESLEEGNRKLIEENDAATEKRRRQISCVDGGEVERLREEAGADPNTND